MPVCQTHAPDPYPLIPAASLFNPAQYCPNLDTHFSTATPHTR
jgi:hypothetical protein